MKLITFTYVHQKCTELLEKRNTLYQSWKAKKTTKLDFANPSRKLTITRLLHERWRRRKKKRALDTNVNQVNSTESIYSKSSSLQRYQKKNASKNHVYDVGKRKIFITQGIGQRKKKALKHRLQSHSLSTWLEASFFVTLVLVVDIHIDFLERRQRHTHTTRCVHTKIRRGPLICTCKIIEF